MFQLLRIGNKAGQVIAVRSLLLSWDSPSLCHNELVQTSSVLPCKLWHILGWDHWHSGFSLAFQGCSYYPCDQQQRINLVSSASYCRLAHVCAVGVKSVWDGLAESTLFALEWAESVQCGCRSEGTCPPWLWLALLSYAGPGLEPRVSRPAQHWHCTHPWAMQIKTHAWSGGTFLRLFHLGFPPDVFLLYSHITEGTKGQEMFL